MTPFEFIGWWIVTGILLLGPLVALGVHAAIRKRRSGNGFDVAMALLFFIGIFSMLNVVFETDNPELYTRFQGHPQSLQIEHLQFLNGLFGSTDQVQVWTNQGVYLLRAGIPIPYTGTVYRIDKLEPFSKTPRAFLCLDASLKQCWQTLPVPGP